MRNFGGRAVVFATPAAEKEIGMTPEEYRNEMKARELAEVEEKRRVLSTVQDAINDEVLDLNPKKETPTKEVAGTARMNITMPAALKAQIDKVKEDVNWSGVAAKAFEEKLQELKSKRKSKTWKEAVERLKIASVLEARAGYKRGYEAGKQWLIEDAQPKQMERLSDYFNYNNLRAEYIINEWEKNRENCAIKLAAIIENLDKDSPALSTYYWHEILHGKENEMSDYDFAIGFVTGSLEFWEKAQKEIEEEVRRERRLKDAAGFRPPEDDYGSADGVGGDGDIPF